MEDMFCHRGKWKCMWLFLQFAMNSQIKWRLGGSQKEIAIVIGVVKFRSIRCFLYS